jgi:signal peptidase I
MDGEPHVRGYRGDDPYARLRDLNDPDEVDRGYRSRQEPEYDDHRYREQDLGERPFYGDGYSSRPIYGEPDAPAYGSGNGYDAGSYGQRYDGDQRETEQFRAVGPGDDGGYQRSREVDRYTGGHSRSPGFDGDDRDDYRRREPAPRRSSAGDGGSWRARAKQVRKNMPLWQELPLLLVVAFCLAVLIRTFLLQAFFIPSGSMEETLQVGDRVLVNKIIYDVRPPERGEIVVFRGTDQWAPENQTDTNVGFFSKLGRTVGDLVGISQPGEKDFIKRVIGLPGDTVACCDVNGRVTVNGYALDEPYVTENSPLDAPPVRGECRSRLFGPITVEPGQMFVMGDHRLVSQDSRCQGQVPIDHVIGRAFVIVWPSGRWAGLGVPSTFAHVPRPFTAMPAPEVPANRVQGVDVVLLVPILASLVVPARSRRIRRSRRRRLFA